MIRSATMVMVALLFAGSASATQLLQDSMDYADDAAMRAVWKADTAGTTDTVWSLNCNGLSFANHFASAGGAITNQAIYSMAYAALDAPVQISGAVGDSSWNGLQFTFYMSYLVRVDETQGWGYSGVASLYRSGYASDKALGSGINQGEMTRNLQPGNRANPSGYSSPVNGAAVLEDTTYLAVAKYVFTNQTSGNPWLNGTLDSSVVFLSEGDAYPTDEASVTWDITDSRDHSAGGPDVSITWLGLLNQAMPVAGMRFDEFRVGTEFGDVVNVPEPATLALVALGGLAALRRR
jgi:PEP-CTERM motif-containing protein